MTVEQMKMRLSAMTGNTNDTILLTAIEMAGAAVIKQRYPFGAPSLEVPAEYHLDQLAIAEYLVNKSGATGQTAHDENGVKRTYESGGIPKSLLKNITPMGKVVGGKG